MPFFGSNSHAHLAYSGGLTTASTETVHLIEAGIMVGIMKQETVSPLGYGHTRGTDILKAPGPFSSSAPFADPNVPGSENTGWVDSIITVTR